MCQKQFDYKSLLLQHDPSHKHKVYECKNLLKKFKREDHYLNHECNSNNEGLLQSFIQTNQVVEGSVRPSYPRADMNSTSIREDVISPNLNISNVETSSDSLTQSSNSQSNIYWKNYRPAKQKTNNLESIMKFLSSPIKRTVTRNLSNSVLSHVVVNIDSSSVHNATVIHSLIEYLKKFNEKRQCRTLHPTIHKIFDKMMLIFLYGWKRNLPLIHQNLLPVFRTGRKETFKK